jgi:hypothetical protein
MRNGLSCSEAGKIGSIAAKEIIAKQKEERISKYLENPTRCKACETIIPYLKRNNKFCCHRCSASFTNTGNRKHGLAPINCLICGNKTESYKNRTCSLKCHKELLESEFIEAWLNGKKTGYSGINNDLSIYIRRWLYKKRGEKCEECSWNILNKNTNKIPLQIHHIDGDSTNNKPENLKILCPNCHSLTSTYGGSNKGNGRKKRYKKVVDTGVVDVA